jgi:hypothetical protein
MFFRMFIFCSARVGALFKVFHDSPCERIGKWETFLILKEGRLLVCVYLERLQ